MALDDKTLQSFFGKQKKASVDSLKTTHNTTEKQNDSLSQNLEQSQNKVGANLEQSQNKVGANLEQSQNKTTSLKLESWNKVSTQLRTEVRTNLEQSQNKVGTNLPFSSITGIQRNIILFIFEETKTSREKLTDPIAIQNLALFCKTTAMAAQVTIRRLEKKGLLIRGEYKDGRGGWTRYELPDALFQELLRLETQNKLGTKSEQSQNKVSTQLRTQLRTSLSSSSSFLDLKNFKTTTTEEVDKIGLESTHLHPEWQLVDLSPLFEIGFTQTHLVQIMRDGKLSSESVQDSIHYFAFDLNKNNKRKEINGHPLNFFMGILRRGMPYAAPANYESPQDQILRKNLVAKRLQSEKRSQMEAEIKEIEFEEWYSKLSEEEKLERVPMLPREGSGRKAVMRSQFDEHIWPELAQAVLGLTKIDRAEISKQIEQSLEENSV